MVVSRHNQHLSIPRKLFLVYSVLALCVVIMVWVTDSMLVQQQKEDFGLKMVAARDDPLWRGQWHGNVASEMNDGSGKKLCPLHPPGLGINVPLNVTTVTYDDIRSLYTMMQRGGYYAPSECRSHNRTAIVIPYRNREGNLMILLRNLIPFLIRQMAEFRLFVVEQTKELEFNKGVLLNAGYLKAKEMFNFTCFVFHDTDYVPADYRNFYRCETYPRHLLVTRSELKHLGPKYATAFGGAVSFTREMFEAVNGFSNRYYGWGKEDDDLRRRFVLRNIPLKRNGAIVGTYYNLDHKLQKRNRGRNKIYKAIKAIIQEDGLSSVFNQSVANISIVEKELFTHILVQVRPLN